MRLSAIYFVIFTLGASGAVAQGMSSVPQRQAPIGHRQPAPSELPPEVRKDEQRSRVPNTGHHDVASDRGGQRAAAMYSLVVTAKMNNVDPQAWLADVRARIAEHPAHPIDQLLPRAQPNSPPDRCYPWSPPDAFESDTRRADVNRAPRVRHRRAGRGRRGAL
jgi:hypothetical protein